MTVALFFAEHRSAINLPITISTTLLSLNSLTLDYIGLLVSFSVSSTNITWMLENALLSLSSVLVVVVVGLFIAINLSIRLLRHCCSHFLPFALVLMQYFHTLYSTDALKLSCMR